jgi:hypothetical protein
MAALKCGWINPRDPRFVALVSRCEVAEEFAKAPTCRRLPGAHAILRAWRLRGDSSVGDPNATARRTSGGATLHGTVQQGTAVDATLCAAVQLACGGDTRPPEALAMAAVALGAPPHCQTRMCDRAGVAAGAALRLLYDRGLTPVATQVPLPAGEFGVCPIADALCIDQRGKMHIVELKFGAGSSMCKGARHKAHLSQLAIQSCCAAVCGFGVVPATRCHLLVVASLRPGGTRATAKLVSLPSRVLKNVRALLHQN